MNKFYTLLKKELKELLTLQMLIPMLVGVLFFVFIGNVMGDVNKKYTEPQNIIILNNDNSASSLSIVNQLKKSNFKITTYTDKTIKEVISIAKEKKVSTVFSIPKGFEKGISGLKPQKIESYSIISDFSMTSSSGSSIVNTVISSINEYVSNALISGRIPGVKPDDIKNPVVSSNHVIIGDKSANVSADQISGFIVSQTIFIPIVMFIIIMFSAQMIAVSIASEKENKTLETLLSTPISRTSLVSAKMLAAGLVSLLMAAVYMFGFKYYMGGLMGASSSSSSISSSTISQLGLSLNTGDYFLLGTSLFLSILVALAMATILGAFAEDVKKVQGLVLPITFLVMIPYILTMFMDVNSSSLLIKIIVYVIPFSHPFLASPYLLLNNYSAVIYGIIYQAVVFGVLVFIAGRIFSTDRILTMKLNFKRKSLFSR